MKTARVRVTKKTKEAPVAEKREVGTADMLVSFKYEGKSIVTKSQAKRLLDLEGERGKLLRPNEPTEVYELLMRIQQYGFDSIYTDLQKEPSFQTYIFRTMRTARESFMLETIQGMIQDKTEEGVFECTRCRREGRDPKQTRSQSMYRRGDEPPVTQVVCQTCSNEWRE